MRTLLLGLCLVLFSCAQEGQKPTPSICLKIKSLDETLNNDERPILIFGKIHGTTEVPSFIGGVVCRAAELNYSVNLAMSFPRSNQNSINEFLISSGSHEDILALMETDFWKFNTNGHSSYANFLLLDDIRKLKINGADIIVTAYTAFDQIESEESKYLGQDYTNIVVEKDAEYLNDLISKATASKTIIVPGDANAVRSEIDFMGLPYKPLAARLPQDKFLSFYLMQSGGTAWVCMLNNKGEGKANVQHKTVCKTHSWPRYISADMLDGRGPELFDYSRLKNKPNDIPDMDGKFFVGGFTASRPASEVLGKK